MPRILMAVGLLALLDAAGTSLRHKSASLMHLTLWMTTTSTCWTGPATTWCVLQGSDSTIGRCKLGATEPCLAI